jgi:hypothetical protein
LLQRTVGIDPNSSLFHSGAESIRCADDLAIIRRVRHRRKLHLFLRVPGLAIDKTSVWEARLNAALKECGCSLGAKSMFAALAGSIIWQFLYSSWSMSHWLGFMGRSVLTVVVAGAIGKLTGLALAEGRLRSIEEHIRKFESNVTGGI